jgi:hypothetical protein
MKKMNIAIPMVLIVGLLLVGCAGATFTISSAGNKSTIEINNAEDSSTAELGSFSVGKGKMAYVESSLEKGQLKIDFAQAIVFREHDTERTIVGDVVTSVTIGPEDSRELPLQQGDYVMILTAIGSTSGKVTVNIK